MFIGLEHALDILFYFVGLGFIFGRNTLEKHLHVMDFVIISHVGVLKNLTFLSLYKCDALAALIYFSPGSGNPDPQVITNTHPRSILAFNKAVRLG
jgi:hypothetical protein